jgi:hypothetical protein
MLARYQLAGSLRVGEPDTAYNRNVDAIPIADRQHQRCGTALAPKTTWMGWQHERSVTLAPPVCTRYIHTAPSARKAIVIGKALAVPNRCQTIYGVCTTR